jgi:hypothetical protein
MLLGLRLLLLRLLSLLWLSLLWLPLLWLPLLLLQVLLRWSGGRLLGLLSNVARDALGERRHSIGRLHLLYKAATRDKVLIVLPILSRMVLP